MNIIKNKALYVLISVIMVFLALFSIWKYGLKESIEFTGGTIVEISYEEGKTSSLEEVSRVVQEINPSSTVQPTEDGFLIRTSFLSDTNRQDLIKALSFNGASPATEERVSSLGPTIGAELKTKAGYAIAAILAITVLFIAYVFRRVSKPISSWWYGLIAILTLLHDVIIPTGVYAYMGSKAGWEVDVLFITALLAIFGLSINDTIVVFDRIRENLKKNEEKEKKTSFADTVGKSLSESFTRSFNTSFTAIITLAALYFFGSDSTQHFALVLLIGMIVGTYSSLFVASPLLVYVDEWKNKNVIKTSTLFSAPLLSSKKIKK